MKTFLGLVVSLLFLSCNGSKQDAAINSAVQKFFKDYSDFRKPVIAGDLDSTLIYWVKASPMLTGGYKKQFEKEIIRAREADPEMGLDYDPIFNAQDIPEKGFGVSNLEIIGNRATVIVIAVDWPDHPINVALVKSNDQWLINGIGNIRATD